MQGVSNSLAHQGGGLAVAHNLQRKLYLVLAILVVLWGERHSHLLVVPWIQYTLCWLEHKVLPLGSHVSGLEKTPVARHLLWIVEVDGDGLGVARLNIPEIENFLRHLELRAGDEPVEANDDIGALPDLDVQIVVNLAKLNHASLGIEGDADVLDPKVVGSGESDDILWLHRQPIDAEGDGSAGNVLQLEGLCFLGALHDIAKVKDVVRNRRRILLQNGLDVLSRQTPRVDAGL